MEKLEFLSISSGNVKWCSYCGKQTLKVLNILLPYNLVIPLLGLYPKELTQGLRPLHIRVHSSSIHNSQKVETTQISIKRWMDKQSVTWLYIHGP